jgi:ABC-type antimicrobial peptide transport system permease subunit
MTLSLTVIMVVNNTLEIVESNLKGMEYMLTSRTIEMPIEYAAYEEMGKQIISDINKLGNKHIVTAYTAGIVNGYAEDERYDITHLPDGVISEYIDGVSSDFKLADDEVLLPKYIDTGDGEIERDEDDYIGKTISYTVYRDKVTYTSPEESGIWEHIDERTYSLKVAGLYDNLTSGMGNSEILVAEDTLSEMKFFARLIQVVDGEEIIEDSDIMIGITVDSYDNVEEVMEVIEDMRINEHWGASPLYTYEFFASEEFYSVEAVRLLINIVASFLIVCAALSLLSYIKDMLNRRKREFGIMKAIGYRTSGICRVLLKELIFEITIPLGIAWLLGIISVAVTDNILKKSFDLFDYAMFDIRLYGNVLALIAGISVMIPLIGYIIMIVRINRLEPVEALK